MLIDELLKITNGKIIKLADNFSVNSDIKVSGMDRTDLSDYLFLPVTYKSMGKINDLHDEIPNAIQNKKCIGFFVDKEHFFENEDSKNFLNECVKNNKDKIKLIILVENTNEAYYKLAAARRNYINPFTIAVTGSLGKTIIVDMLHHIFSGKEKAIKSLSSDYSIYHNIYDNLISMEEDTKYAVVELSCDSNVPISSFESIKPDLLIINNIRLCHIGPFGSLENIAVNKCSAADYMNPKGTVIIPDCDESIEKYLEWQGQKILIDDEKAIILDENADGITFNYKETQYKINIPGEHIMKNALFAIETAILAGFTPEEIAQRLKSYKNSENRWQVSELKNGSTIINETVHCTPFSAIASLKTLDKNYPDSKKIFILGDFYGLGKKFSAQYHKEFADYLNNSNIERFIAVGQRAKITANTLLKNNSKIKILVYENNENSLNLLHIYLLSCISSPNTKILITAPKHWEFHKITESLKKYITGA